MDAEFETVWINAQQQYLSRLKARDFARLSSVTTQQQLIAQTREVCARYNSRSVTRLLQRADPFLATLHSFSEVIKKFVETSSTFTGLIWGLLSLGIEVSAKHATILERTVDSLEQLDRALPRFHLYLRKFGSREVSTRLQQSLVHYYAELIATCQDVISFSRRSPIYNVVISSFISFKNPLDKRARRLRELTSWVDREADIASEEAAEARQNFQHQELLTQLKSAQMYVGPLPFHNLPAVRNPTFHGRQDILNLLQQRLLPQHESTDLAAVSISGLGGAGKTQIALEYAYRYLHVYDAIFWVTSETLQKLAEAFARIAFGMDLASENTQQQQDHLRERVKQYLYNVSARAPDRRSIKWLLIFDNVEDPKSLQNYWPQGCNGSVIVTSRNTDLCRNFIVPSHRLELGPFSKSEGQSFLASLLGGVTNQAVAETDIHAAGQISDALGHLPLALNLVGTYVAVNGLSYSRFLVSQPDFERKFLFQRQNSYWDAQAYQQSLDNTWTLNLLNLDSNARFIVDLLAFMDSDGVPVDFFRSKPRDALLCEGPEEPFAELESYLENPIRHNFELDEAVGRLLRTSLVSRGRENELVSCHRLLQIAIINAMPTTSRQTVFHRATYLLNAVFPQQHDGTPMYDRWRICEAYCRQVSALIDNYNWLKDDIGYPVMLCEVTARSAWFCFEKGRFNESQNMVYQALSIFRSALESGNHPGFSECYVKEEITHLLNVKASISLQKCDYHQGLELCQEIRRLREEYRRVGNAYDDKWLAFADGQIAVALMGVNQPLRALDILHTLLAREDTTTNRDVYFSNLAICLILLERYEEALQTCHQAMDLIRAKRGPESAQMALVLFYICRIYRNQGNLDQAFDAISRCFSLYKSIMPDHHYTGLTAHKLGEIVRERGDLHSAISFFEEALPILQHSEYHPGGYCRTAFALAEVLAQVGDFTRAAFYQSAGEVAAREFSAEGLGTDAHNYAQFVGFPHR